MRTNPLSDAEVLQRFNIGAPPGRRVYSTKCPAHDDRTASLSVGLSPRRWVKCHKGCRKEEVLQAAGIGRAEWNPRGEGPGSWPSHIGDLLFSCAYWLYDLEGKEIAAHLRYQKGNKKTLRWWKDGKLSLGAIPLDSLPLYNAHRVKDFDKNRRVFLVEGEKDCDALLLAGLQAVGTVCGASSAPSALALSVLKG